MKILSVSQIREADAYTIANEPIASIDLMERAARACYKWFHEHISRTNKIAIVCGMGNNGGDGLALARMLKAAGYAIELFVVKHSKNGSQDFNTNLHRLADWNLQPLEIASIEMLAQKEADVWVDAILGSGLNSTLRGLILEVVNTLNAKQGLKVAIDIPTGLFADDNSENDVKLIFRADHTLSFQFPKRSFLFPEFGALVGQFHVLDIGLSAEFINSQQTQEHYLTWDWIKQLLPKRNKFDHKGTFGHALVIAGSKGKIGAGILVSRAALKSGAGLVSVYLPQCGLNPMQAANPEVMVQLDKGESQIENILFDLLPDAIGIGPGLGTDNTTRQAVINFIANQPAPMVIDADALNNLSLHGDWSIVPENSILTPHLGELDRILDGRFRGEAVFEPTRKFAMQYNLNVLVKGAHSALYAPDGNVYFNSTGTSSMATAGSGDVLTGIITGLLAQGMSPQSAAMAGMYFHGLAGEDAAIVLGDRAVTAGDIIDFLAIE